MKRMIFTVLMAAFATVALGGSLRASIVVNGSFENPNIDGTLFVPVNSGSTFITGWTVAAPSSSQGVDLVSSSTGTSGFAFQGTQAVDLSGTPGPGSIFQDLTTTPGTNYLLQFTASSNGGEKILGLSVTWGALNLGPFNTPAQNSWQTFSFVLPASTNTTRLEFISNVQGSFGPLLDAVTVDALPVVPEPTTFAVMALGGLGLISAVRRRRTRQTA